MLIVDSLCRAHVKSQFQVLVTQREHPAAFRASQNDSGFGE
jgi:hypothetical protein